MSSNSSTRVYSRPVDKQSPLPKPPAYSVVEPAARTTLFPARTPNEPVPAPASPAQDASEPRARFSDGGTQILPGRPSPQGPRPIDSAQTQHFAVEQLLSRRAELNRERERELNRELDQELALLASDVDGRPQLEVPAPLEAESPPAKPKKLALRLSMVGLLLASVAMLVYDPSPEVASPRPPTPVPTQQPAEPTVRSRVEPAHAPAVAPSAHGTLQRSAADVIAEGRYAEALTLYRQLAESEPTNPAYAEVVEILEQRLAAPRKPPATLP